MKLSSAISVAALFFATGSVAAQQPQITWRSTAKTAVFVEVLGNGGLLTYNVDRKLNQRTTARLAYGDFRSIELGDQDTKHYQTLTAMLNALAGGPTWWWEIGVGGRIGRYRGEDWVIPAKPLRDITSVLGLRRQPLGGGMVFRAGVTPRYVVWGDDDPPGGLSMGVGLSIGLAF
jgi:hypothetical protein